MAIMQSAQMCRRDLKVKPIPPSRSYRMMERQWFKYYLVNCELKWTHTMHRIYIKPQSWLVGLFNEQCIWTYSVRMKNKCWQIAEKKIWAMIRDVAEIASGWQELRCLSIQHWGICHLVSHALSSSTSSAMTVQSTWASGEERTARRAGNIMNVLTRRSEWRGEAIVWCSLESRLTFHRVSLPRSRSEEEGKGETRREYEDFEITDKARPG